MSTKSITGTGLLLAVALLAQSLRLIFPFIPNQVSMFLIGSYYVRNLCTRHMALWLEEWPSYCLDCTSSGAFTRHVALAAVHFDYRPWHDSLCIRSALVTI